MPDEKRKEERNQTAQVCRYSYDGRERADLSKNISAGGVFIRTTSAPPIGTRLTVLVRLFEEEDALPVRLTGRVIHVHSDPDPEKQGMGIAFEPDGELPGQQRS